MGKFCDTLRVSSSPSSNSVDSLQLIEPVNNLTLEQKKSDEDINNQVNHLKQSKKNKTYKQSRHHPYFQQNNKSKRNIQINKDDECDMDFLKSLGYIEYSSTKRSNLSEQNDHDSYQSLYIQINQAIKTTFAKYTKSIDQTKSNDYVCNKRFH